MRHRDGLLPFLFCAGLASVCVATPAPPAPPDLSGNWKLSFDDEFNSLNSDLWQQTIWGITNPPGEGGALNSSAVNVSKGKLRLTASNTPLDGKSWTTGLVDTGPAAGSATPGYSFQYGYAEACIKVVSGQALWPAFWMLPVPDSNGVYHDNAGGEVDIMEELGQQPNIDEVHYLQNGQNLGTGIDAKTDLSKGYHTYAVNWQPGEIDYYLDGKKIWSVDQSPDVPEYLILDLWVGNNDWTGSPNQSTPSPATMSVDYVRVWQSNVPEPASASLVLGPFAAALYRRPSRRKA